MTIYDRARQTASKLFTKFGQGVVSLQRDVPGEGGDAWNPPVAVPVNYGLNATVSGVTARYVDGTLVTASDLMVRCAVPEVEPLITDRVIIDGTPRAILKIQPIPAAGTPAAYLIFVKG
mgnify:CR=1 FL=1